MGIQKWQVSIKLGYIVDIKSMVMGFLLASTVLMLHSHYFLTHSEAWKVLSLIPASLCLNALLRLVVFSRYFLSINQKDVH